MAFILSRDVFVLTRIKTRVVFPRPPLLTPDEGPSLETSIFSFIVLGSEITFTFRVLCLNFTCIMLLNTQDIENLQNMSFGLLDMVSLVFVYFKI